MTEQPDSLAPPRTDLTALLPEEIGGLLKAQGQPPYRGLQVFNWIHARRAVDFEAMTNLPRDLRAWLAANSVLTTLEPTDVQDSQDGSRKLIFDAAGGGQFSAVLMPSEDRVTLCISSQVGCRMGCRFCLTATLGFRRNLSAAEIVGQVHAASRLLPEGSRVTNVVFMGMGEPLDNLENVIRAVRVMTHREGLRVAPRKTTVSTVGLLPRLADLIRANTGCSIAISLCATTDEVRREIVPTGKKYELDALLEILRTMPPPHGHCYTIEYLLMKGVGDSAEDARRLSRFLAHFPAKVNLIPFNPWPGAPFDRPDPRSIETFHRILSEKNHRVSVRWSRGQDVGAACGQLDGRLSWHGKDAPDDPDAGPGGRS